MRQVYLSEMERSRSRNSSIRSVFFFFHSTNDTGGRAGSNNAKHKFETEQMMPKIGSHSASIDNNTLTYKLCQQFSYYGY